MSNMNHPFKYFAFISYSSHDMEWGKRLQRKLEHYRMPSTLCSEHGWERTPIKPVFFAPADIQPGGLTEELQQRLRASRNLIVVCSPHSARSQWVGKEIEFFHSLGRTKQIYFFIVDGEPHSGNKDTECFNPVVEALGLPEILAANINELTQTYPFTSIPCPRLNKERAYVQLISKLLGVEFDTLWQRHKRLLVQRAAAYSLAAVTVMAALAGAWIANLPVDVEVRLNEHSVHNDSLPPMKDAIVTLSLDNETKTDTVHEFGGCATFANIPHRCLGKEVHATVTCRDFHTIDTTFLLTKDVCLNIQRDPSVYGHVHFVLWNPNTEQAVARTALEIAGRTVASDDSGRVSLFVPLEQQRKAYHIASTLPMAADSVYMPCGPDDEIPIQ